MKLNIDQTPSPQPSLHDIIQNIEDWKRHISDQDPRNWIFIYDEGYAPDRVMMVGPDAFYDRKRRVFLNPKHEAKITEYLATLADADV